MRDYYEYIRTCQKCGSKNTGCYYAEMRDFDTPPYHRWCKSCGFKWTSLS